VPGLRRCGQCRHCWKCCALRLKNRGLRYPLSALLALAGAAMLCGYRSYSAISKWGRNYDPAFLRALGLTCYLLMTGLSASIAFIPRISCPGFPASAWQLRLATLPASPGHQPGLGVPRLASALTPTYQCGQMWLPEGVQVPLH